MPLFLLYLLLKVLKGRKSVFFLLQQYIRWNSKADANKINGMAENQRYYIRGPLETLRRPKHEKQAQQTTNDGKDNDSYHSPLCLLLEGSKRGRKLIALSIKSNGLQRLFTSTDKQGLPKKQNACQRQKQPQKRENKPFYYRQTREAVSRFVMQPNIVCKNKKLGLQASYDERRCKDNEYAILHRVLYNVLFLELPFA